MLHIAGERLEVLLTKMHDRRFLYGGLTTIELHHGSLRASALNGHTTRLFQQLPHR
jgi:hypothetical protein